MVVNHGSAFSEGKDFGIGIESSLHPHHAQKIVVHGKFRVQYEQIGVPTHATQTLKHLVLVVSRAGNYQTVTPFKDVVVFDDDVYHEKDGCSAFFNIDVMDHIHFNGVGEYYVLCSVGAYISNIVKVVVS